MTLGTADPQQNPATPAFAPVIVFAYARADHLRRTVDSLLGNEQAGFTDVIFFCDAAKRPEHQAQIDAVRAYVDSVTGFRSVQRIYRERNMGLAASVIDGVTCVLETHGRAIVIEDDMLLSPHFLGYMNAGLDRYANDERVASIHGYSYPVEETLPETFFLRGADCWGWATWSRAWAHFERDGKKLLHELRRRRLCRDFDFDGRFPYTEMLEHQITGRNSSWAIRWYASCYLKGLVTLYPGRSLVENIGNDSSGTHCDTTDALSREPTRQPVQVGDIPVEPSAEGRQAFVRFFNRQRSWHAKLRTSLGYLLKNRL